MADEQGLSAGNSTILNKLDYVTGVRTNSGEKRFGRQSIDNLASQLATSGPIATILGAGGNFTPFPTKAAMDGDLNHDNKSIAWVSGDGANDGYYRKSGASGSGLWIFFHAPIEQPTDVDDVSYTEIASANAGGNQCRPGEPGDYFGTSQYGTPDSITPIADDDKILSSHSRVARIAGAGVVARRLYYRMEPGRSYRLRVVVYRSEDTSDPANDAIRIGLVWMGSGYATIVTKTVADLVDVTVSDGRIERTYDFPTEDIPLGGDYARPFVRTFGGDGQTDIEVIDIVDMSNAVDWSPNVDALTAAVAAQQVEIDTLEAKVSDDVIVATWPGVTVGTLANDTLRTANYTAVQEALDYAHANNLPVVLPKEGLEIKGGRTDLGSGLKMGLQFRNGIPRVRGNQCLIVQYEADMPVVMLGEAGDDYTYGGRYEDFAVGMGVDGGTHSAGIAYGSHWQGLFRNLGVNGNTGFKPQKGWWQATGNFFSNVVLTLTIGAAKESFFFADQGGSGNWWVNVYLGGGNEDNLQVITGSALYLENKVADIFDLTRIEWIQGNQFVFMNNVSTHAFRSLRFEGCRLFSSFGSCFIRAYNGNTKVNIDKLELYECNIKSADNGGGMSILSAGFAAGFDVRGFEMRTRSGTGWGTTNMPIYLFAWDTADDPILAPSCKVTDIIFPSAVADTGFYPDRTLRANEGPTLDKYLSIGEYEYDRVRSRVRHAVLAIEAEPAGHLIQLYGCFEDCTFLLRNFTLTADLQINVAGSLVSYDGGFGASGPGSGGGFTLYPKPGNTYQVLTNGLTFGGHAIRSLRAEFRPDPANAGGFSAVYVALAELTANGSFLVGFSGTRAVQIGAGVAGETYIDDNLGSLMAFRTPASVAVSDKGAQAVVQYREELVTLSGPSVNTTMTVPNTLLLAVSTRVTQAITGATSFDCGVSGELTKFGSALAKTLGSVNSGVIEPTLTAAGLPITLTAEGSNFTGGKVRVSIAFWAFVPAAS
jgi:hypothetical protein